MSTGSSLMRQTNVNYQEAQRAEAQEAWSLAASAYLRALTLNPTTCSEASEDLARLVAQSGELKVRVLWALGLVTLKRWSEAEAALAPLPEHPLNLSHTLTKRWAQLKERRAEDGASLSLWVRALQLTDRVLSMGYPAEALSLVERAVSQISSSEKSALVLYEGARLGIMHQQVQAGVAMMREAIARQELLRERARRLVDEVLTEGRAEGADLEELLSLRIKRVDDLLGWVSALTSATPLAQRAALSYTLAQRCELGLKRLDVAALFYAASLEAAHEAQGRALSQVNPLASSLSVEGLARLASLGEPLAEERARWCATQGLPAPLIKLLSERAYDEATPREARGEAAFELATLSAEQGAFERALEAVKLAVRFTPERVDLRALIRQARQEQAWAPLDQLFSLQLNHTRSARKQQAILIAQAKTRRARGLEAAAYLALLGALHIGQSAEASLALDELLLDDEARAAVIAWLLRPDASTRPEWLDEVLTCVGELRRLFPSATLIASQPLDAGSSSAGPLSTHSGLGSELTATQLHDATADEEDDLNATLHADLISGEGISGDDSTDTQQGGEGDVSSLSSLSSLSSPQDPVETLLSAALSLEPRSWALAHALLTRLEETERHEDWLSWLVSAQKSQWPQAERVALISRGVGLSRELESELGSQLLRDVASQLTETNATLDERLEAWGSYLDAHPADRHALEVFAELAGELGAWEALLTRYEDALVTRKTGKIHLLELAAELCERELSDPQRAARFWWEILELKPNHDRAGEWLSLKLSSEQRWEELLTLCARWRPSQNDVSLWREALLQAHLGLSQLPEALEQWRSLQEERTQRLYLPALLTLAEARGDGPLIVHLLSLDEALYQEPELPHAPHAPHFPHDVRVESEETVLRRSFDELGGDELGGDELGGDELPPSLPTEEDLEEMASESLSELSAELESEAASLRNALASTQHVTRRMRLKARALTYLSPTRDSFAAIEAWRELRALSSRDEEACLALTELYAETGRRDELMALMELAERWCGVQPGMQRVLIQGALSLEARFDDSEEAFRLWALLLERAPHQAPRVTRAVERLAARAEMWSQLDELWVRYAELITHSVDRDLALLAQARLCAGPLHHWQIALELASPLEQRLPYNADVRALYPSTAMPLRRWEELAERAYQWAEALPNGVVKARRLRRLGHFCETRLERPQEALRCYERAHEMSQGELTQALNADLERARHLISAERPRRREVGG